MTVGWSHGAEPSGGGVEPGRSLFFFSVCEKGHHRAITANPNPTDLQAGGDGVFVPVVMGVLCTSVMFSVVLMQDIIGHYFTQKCKLAIG